MILVARWRRSGCCSPTSCGCSAPTTPGTLSTRSNLAHWQGEAGDAAGAVEAFEELLTDRTRVLGPDHPSTLITRDNVAYWRQRAGLADDAAP